MTVKADDRPSGSAGDSASVSTPLFRISVELSLRGVCLSRRSEATPLSYQDKHTPRLQMVVLVPIKDEYGSLNVGFEKLVQAHLKACHSSGFMI